MSRGNIHLILKNDFYIGSFRWAGETLSRHATSANCRSVLCAYDRFHRVLFRSASAASCCVVAAHDERT